MVFIILVRHNGRGLVVWGCAGSRVTITVCFRWLVERVLLVVECHIPFITISIFDCRSLTSALVKCACVQSVWCIVVCGAEYSTQVPLRFLQSCYVCALALALGVSVPGTDAQDNVDIASS